MQQSDCSVAALAALVLFLAGFPGCNGQSALVSQSGFFEIKPTSFYFHKGEDRLDLTSSPARLWYTFEPADDLPGRRPLLLFFNGGPGVATTNGLLAINTSRMTLDASLTGGSGAAACPSSWTGLGNLLYIDARQTGFSYSLMEHPEDEAARGREFDAQNFNCFTDAADFICGLLQFLSAHPALQANPVILVGESYGGLRATVMLHMLFKYRDYANGEETYQDSRLVEAIQAHYDRVFPAYRGGTVPPEVIARQFGRQVLIEPLLSGQYQDRVAGQMFEQPGSVIYQVAAETGTKFTPCPAADDTCLPFDNALTFIDETAQRDYYDYTRPAGWLIDLYDSLSGSLETTGTLSALTGFDVTKIGSLYAEQRTGAYRGMYAGGGAAPATGYGRTSARVPVAARLLRQRLARKAMKKAAAQQGDMPEIFGTLQPWDSYFEFISLPVNDAFYDNAATDAGYDISPDQPRYGSLFLENILHCETFITAAGHDLIIYAPAVAGALALHADTLESAELDTAGPEGAQRPGRIVLKFKQGAFGGSGEAERVIRFPAYAGSCHSVSVTQPVDLLADVSAWLESSPNSGISPYGRQ